MRLLPVRLTQFYDRMARSDKPDGAMDKPGKGRDVIASNLPAADDSFAARRPGAADGAAPALPSGLTGRASSPA
jgi:hypothetical protein